MGSVGTGLCRIVRRRRSAQPAGSMNNPHVGLPVYTQTHLITSNFISHLNARSAAAFCVGGKAPRSGSVISKDWMWHWPLYDINFTVKSCYKCKTNGSINALQMIGYKETCY